MKSPSRFQLQWHRRQRWEPSQDWSRSQRTWYIFFSHTLPCPYTDDLTCVGKHWQSSWLRWCKETPPPPPPPPHGCWIQPRSWPSSRGRGRQAAILRGRSCFDQSVVRVLLSSKCPFICAYSSTIYICQKQKLPDILFVCYFDLLTEAVDT